MSDGNTGKNNVSFWRVLKVKYALLYIFGYNFKLCNQIFSFAIVCCSCYVSINIGHFQCSRLVVQSDSSGGDDDDGDHDTENPKIVVKYGALCVSDARDEFFFGW